MAAIDIDMVQAYNKHNKTYEQIFICSIFGGSLTVHMLGGIGMASKVYILENLGCAHCASQIEEKVRQLPQVQEAVMVFATKQLRVKTDQPEELEQQIETIAQSFFALS